jgi:hypothetical protein
LIAVVLTAFITLPVHAVAWNIPGHMLSGAIAIQILRRESAYTIEAVKTILESHPWYANQWQAQLEKLPSIDRDEIIFMLAARWADDIDWPFKPDGQPGSVQTTPPAMGCSRQRLASSQHWRKTNGLPKRTTTPLVDGLHWEPDGVTLHVRFCEGPETNGRMVEIAPYVRIDVA